LSNNFKQEAERYKGMLKLTTFVYINVYITNQLKMNVKLFICENTRISYKLT